MMPRILIAEDDPQWQDLCQRALEKRGYTVFTASHGREAIGVAQDEPFDLLLTELHLPRLGGLELYQSLKGLYPDMVGIAMTGQGTLDLAIQALRLGFADFITKPFTARELLDSVQRVLLRQSLLRESTRLRSLVPLYELSQTFMSTVDLDQVLQEVVEASQQATDAERVSLMLLDDTRTFMTIRAHAGLPEEVAAETKVVVGEGVAGIVAASGEPLLLTEGEELAPEIAQAMSQPHIPSAICVPLKVKGIVIGVLSLSRLETGLPFKRSDLELVTVLASQAATAIENARLFAKTRERMRRLEILNEVSTFLLKSHELGELLQSVIEKLVLFLGVEMGVIALLAEEGQELTVEAAYGLGDRGQKGKRVAVVGRENLAGHVLATLQPVLCESSDDKLLRGPFAELLGRRASLTVPIVGREKPLGLISLASQEGRLWTEEDRHTLATVANQLGIATEEVRAYQEMQELSQMSSRIASSVDLDQVLDLVMSLPSQLAGATASAILLRGEGTEPYQVARTNGLDERELAVLQRYFGEDAYGRDTPLFVTTEEKPEGLDERVVSLLSLPLSWRERPLGVLNAYFATPRQPPQRVVRLLSTLANEVAAALENERLRGQEVLTLYEVDQTIRAELNLAKLLDRLLDKTIETCGAENGSIMLFDEENGMLVPWTWRGLVERPGNVPCGENQGLAGWVAATLQSSMVHDVREDARWRPSEATADLIRSAIVVPMAIGGKLIGVINLGHHLSHAFSTRNLNLLSTVASQAALAIRNAQLYMRSEELVIAEERSRIAREIHDGIAQDLAFLILKVEICRKLLKEDPNGAEKELVDIKSTLRRNVKEVRRSIFALRPIALEVMGLAPALRKYVREFGQQNDLEVDVAISEETMEIPPKLETALFRLAQEALNNVRKHAQASQVWVSLDREDKDNISLMIRDDGLGFDLREATSRRGRFGLLNMKERIEKAGGIFEIETAPGQGTKVRATLPIRGYGHELLRRAPGDD